MLITNAGVATQAGPGDWFTGVVLVDAVAAPPPPGRVRVNSVHFTPGARTAWHTHPLGQTIFVTEGVGVAQRRGGQLELLRPGDRVYFDPGEEHWHGAAPGRFMTHLAIHELDEHGVDAVWGVHVSDAEYPPEGWVG